MLSTIIIIFHQQIRQFTKSLLTFQWCVTDSQHPIEHIFQDCHCLSKTAKHKEPTNAKRSDDYHFLKTHIFQFFELSFHDCFTVFANQDLLINATQVYSTKRIGYQKLII